MSTSPEASSEPIEQLQFEDALRRLETIVGQLETGEVPLQQAIDLYAEGARLKAQCEARLAAAQARIETIVTGTDGAPVGLKPFDGA